jgi:hypothetical protein
MAAKAGALVRAAERVIAPSDEGASSICLSDARSNASICAGSSNPASAASRARSSGKEIWTIVMRNEYHMKDRNIKPHSPTCSPATSSSAPAPLSFRGEERDLVPQALSRSGEGLDGWGCARTPPLNFAFAPFDGFRTLRRRISPLKERAFFSP